MKEKLDQGRNPIYENLNPCFSNVDERKRCFADTDKRRRYITATNNSALGFCFFYFFPVRPINGKRVLDLSSFSRLYLY